MLEYITKELKNKKIIIVVPLSMVEDVHKFCSIEQVKYIYYHTIDSGLN